MDVANGRGATRFGCLGRLSIIALCWLVVAVQAQAQNQVAGKKRGSGAPVVCLRASFNVQVHIEPITSQVEWNQKERSPGWISWDAFYKELGRQMTALGDGLQVPSGAATRASAGFLVYRGGPLEAARVATNPACTYASPTVKEQINEVLPAVTVPPWPARSVLDVVPYEVEYTRLVNDPNGRQINYGQHHFGELNGVLYRLGPNPTRLH